MTDLLTKKKTHDTEQGFGFFLIRITEKLWFEKSNELLSFSEHFKKVLNTTRLEETFMSKENFFDS